MLDYDFMSDDLIEELIGVVDDEPGESTTTVVQSAQPAKCRRLDPESNDDLMDVLSRIPPFGGRGVPVVALAADMDATPANVYSVLDGLCHAGHLVVCDMGHVRMSWLTEEKSRRAAESWLDDQIEAFGQCACV